MLECVKDLIYVKMLMEQMGIQITGTTLMCDNQAAIKVVKDERYNSKTRHLGSKTAFIRHYIQEKIIEVEYVSTDKNIADILTKALGPKKHEEFIRSIGLGGVWNKPPNRHPPSIT